MCQGDFGEILSRRYQKNVPAMVGEVRPTFEKEGLLTKEIIKRRCKFKGGYIECTLDPLRRYRLFSGKGEAS
jgi:hypothetical protein